MLNLKVTFSYYYCYYH